jgi:hypothetical protein
VCNCGDGGVNQWQNCGEPWGYGESMCVRGAGLTVVESELNWQYVCECYIYV